MSTTIYGLFDCRTEADASSCHGEILYTCDTLQMAQEYAESDGFKDSLHITNTYQWESQNAGERAESPIVITTKHGVWRRFFVIASIPHNPTKGDRF